jgi:hypothetical protein
VEQYLLKVVEQYLINFFFECGAVSFDFVEQYLLISRSSIPNQFQKGLGYAVVKTVGFSANCTRVAQGLHKGCTRTSQGPHKDRTRTVQGPHSACFFPIFLLFKLERRNLGAQGHFKFSAAHGHFKFSVAHGHFQISVAHGQFKFSVARGHIKFSVAHGHFKFSVAQGHFKFVVARGHLQIPCGTQSFQIL